MNEETMRALVEIGINTRDFCGDETKAIGEHASELGVTLDDNTRFIIMSRIDQEWERQKEQARRF